jgi:hypothetical protein
MPISSPFIEMYKTFFWKKCPSQGFVGYNSIKQFQMAAGMGGPSLDPARQ